MFGLTKREKLWKAEQQAVELIVGLAATAVTAAAQVRVAEEQTNHVEMARVCALYNELLYAVAKKFPGETRHETALRYIRQAEAPQPGHDKAYMPAERPTPTE